MPPASDDEITVAAAAKWLGLSQHTVEVFIERGELAGEVIVPTDRPRQRRRIRIRRSAIDEYLERARVKPGELRHLYPALSWERPGPSRASRAWWRGGCARGIGPAGEVQTG